MAKVQENGAQDQAAKMREQGYLPAAEVAKLVGKHISAIYRAAEAGKLEHIRVGSAWYIEKKSIVGWVGKPGAKLLGIT